MSAPPTVHSPRSPSGYHRWAHCLDAAHAEAGYPDDTSPWAAQGTLFHTIVAALLDAGPTSPLEALDYLDETRVIDGHEVVCDEEMVRHLEDAVDFIGSLPGRLFIEKKVTLERWMPGEWGTTDVGLVQMYEEEYVDCSCYGGLIPSSESDECGRYKQCGKGNRRRSTGRITICDWKYGSEPVEAEGNEQLRLYGLGFWNWLTNRYDCYDDITDFRFIIRQPRVEGGNSHWDVTLPELLAFGEEAAQAHRTSLKKGNPRTPGKKTCRWCKAKPSCKAYNDFIGDIVGAKFNDMMPGAVEQLSPPKYLSPEQRAFVLLHKPMISSWLKSLEADALNDGLKGRPTPGQKVIVGRRGQRKWRDEAVVKPMLIDMLGDKAIVESILTPTEAEKALTRAEYAEIASKHITQDEGKPVLVGENEKGTPFVSYDEKFQQMAIEAEGEE